MIKLIFTSFFLSLLLAPLASIGAEAGQKVLVISDIDDTIRVRHVNGFLGLPSLINLMSEREFVGMPDLFNAMKHDAQTEIHYITNSDKEKNQTSFIKELGFPEGVIHFRDKSKYKGKVHKLATIRSLLSEKPHDIVIFIGDDTEADFEVYEEITNEMNARNEHSITFIRRIDAEEHFKLLSGQIPFVSAVEIALSLKSIGIVSPGSVQVVVSQVTSTLIRENEFRDSGRILHRDEFSSGHRVFPGYMECDGYRWSWESELAQYPELIPYKNHVSKICR